MSGSTIGSVVGAGIGFAVGGPAGARWGWMIGGLLGGIISPQVVQGARWNNQQLQGSRDGLPRAVVFGTSTVVGNIMDANPDGPKIGTKKEQQGKGGPVVKRDTAILTYAVEICDSSELRGTKINGVIAVWEDERLVYDLRPDSQLSMADSAKWAANKKFYYGGELQTAPPELEAIHGVGNVPAYRGTCFMTATDEDLMVDVRGDPRGRLPTYRFLVSQCAIVPATAGFAAFAGTGHAAAGAKAIVRPMTSGGALIGSSDSFATTITTTSITAFAAIGGAYHALISGVTGMTRQSADLLTWAAGPAWPGASSIRGSAINGAEWIVSSSETVVRSLISGTWSSSPTFSGGFLNNNIVSVAAAKETVVACNQYGSFWTRDKLGTWSRGGDVFYNATYNRFYTYPGTIAASPADGRVVVSGASDNGLPAAYSDDFGTTWNYSTFVGAHTGAATQVSYVGNRRWIIASDSGFYKSTDNGATFSTITLPAASVAGGPQYQQSVAYDPITQTVILAARRTIDSAYVFYISSDLSAWAEIDKTGTETIGIVSLNASGVAIPDAPGYYVAPDGSIIGPSLGEGTECGANLQTIVRTIHKLGAPQLVDADFDLSALAGNTVPGFVIQDTNLTAADACEPLRKVYLFDLPSFDLKIRAIKRGGSVDLAVSPDDVIATKDGYDVFTRGQSIEYPKKLHVGYLDPALDYKPTTQISERYSSGINVVGEETIDTLLTLTADDAKQAAHKLHKLLWSQLEDTRTLSLPIEYLEIAPASLVEYDGRRYRIDSMRIEGTRIVLDTMAYDRGSIYTSGVVGVPGQAPAPPTGSVRGPTVSALMCLPALRPEDDAPGIYWAASGLLSGWRGATLDISRDGVTFADSGVSTGASATMGTIDAALPASGRYAQDWNNSIDVTLTATSDALDSVDFAALVAGANAAAIIRPDNTAEIIQWQTAVENAPGKYSLTGLLRGRMNTTPASHAAGAQFVVLDGAIRFVPLRMTDEGQPITFRAVTDTTNADDNDSVAITVTLESLREWAPYCVRSTLDSGTIDATWVGRGRLGSSRAPVQSLRFADYRMTADDGSTTIVAASVVQSISVSAGALTPPYTATVAARSALSSIYDSPEGS